MEPMHKDFPLIPQRSYDAIVRNGWLSEVLLALIVDPLEAEDFALGVGRYKEYERLYNEHPYAPHRALPIHADDFVKQGSNATDAWRQVIMQWVGQQKDARPALSSLTLYNRWLGAWCVSHVAREVLDLVAGNKDSLLKQINATEDWACGKLTTGQVRELAASVDPYDTYDFVANVARSSMSAAMIIDDYNAAEAAKRLAERVADAYAEASGTSEERWTTVCSEELVRLRGVVAEACMTFPV